MLDPKRLREDIDQTATQLRKRNFELDVQRISALEAGRKEAQITTEQLRNQRNQHAKKIGQAKAQGQDVTLLLAESQQLGEALKQQEVELENILEDLKMYALTLPNIPDESVPLGNSEEDNLEVRRWEEPTVFTFTPKDHIELGAPQDCIDFASASKMSGSRFVILRGPIARLHRGLAQFMLDIHTQVHGYTEINVPLLVNHAALYGTGQMPKFAEEQFFTQTEPEMALISTSEIPVTNSVRDTILEADQLPLRYVCHSTCFRSEAGSYGKDTRGMIRQHQFEKVELVHIVKPQDSFAALETLTGHAEIILKKLELPYRVVVLCGGDLGFSATKTYDLEVWLPGQQRYREISSCSNTLDFQARRMHARWRNPETGKPELVHTLNGSGLAVGRTLIAVMENYQQEDGSIRVPEVLIPYMGGLTQIK